jgi:hypothetical protein
MMATMLCAGVAALLLSGSAPAFAQASCGRPAAIQFAPGTSGAVVEGGAPRGEISCYTLTARAGQRMEVTISSIENNGVFQIYAPGWTDKPGDGPDGKPLPGVEPGTDAMRFSGVLPASGRYLVVVGATRGGTGFTLRVSIK